MVYNVCFSFPLRGDLVATYEGFSGYLLVVSLSTHYPWPYRLMVPDSITRL